MTQLHLHGNQHLHGGHMLHRHSVYRMSKMQRWLLVCATLLILMAGTAALASYVARTQVQDASVRTVPSSTVAGRSATPPSGHAVASAQPSAGCNDRNIVGYLAGGALGGILGSQVGKGSGKTAATIAGTAGGALVGGQYLPTRNVTCQ